MGSHRNSESADSLVFSLARPRPGINHDAALAILISIFVHQGALGHDCSYAMAHLFAVDDPDRPRNSARNTVRVMETST